MRYGSGSLRRSENWARERPRTAPPPNIWGLSNAQSSRAFLHSYKEQSV